MKKLLSPRTLQNLMLILALLFIIIIAFLSIEIRNETKNPLFWDVDFKRNADIISAYGTLIGGILSFLSILFVLYNVYEVRQQLHDEKLDKAIEEYNISLNRLKLISLTMNSTYNSIITQGENFEKYYKEELANPAMPSEISRVIVKNLDRLSNLEMEKVFLSLQTLDSDKDWSEILRDFFKYNDFYKDSINQIFIAINQHIDDKGESIDLVTGALENLQELVERFMINYGRPTIIDANYGSKWNEKIENFYRPLKTYVSENYEVDLQHIGNHHLHKFVLDCQIVIRDEGFVSNEIQQIFNQAVYIRNRIDNIKKNSLEIAELIKTQFEKYYKIESSKLSEYNRVRMEIKDFIDRC